MNTRVLTIASAMAASAAFAEPAYLPGTSYESIPVTPPPSGSISVIGDGSSHTMVVGNGRGTPGAVVDDTALRGKVVRRLDPSEYAVSADTNFTYNGEIWVMDATSVSVALEKIGVIDVVLKQSYDIEDVRVDANCANLVGAGDASYKVETEISGGGRIISLVMGSPAAVERHYGRSAGTNACPYRLTITDIVITCRMPGSTDEINDLSDKSIVIRDSVGEINLRDLRNNCYHHNDGNLGENWAKYPAEANVMVGNKHVGFGATETDDRYRMVYGKIPTNGISVAIASTNGLSLIASGQPVVTMYGQSDKSSGDYAPLKPLAFEAVDPDSGSVNLRYRYRFSHDIDNFKPELLTLYYTHGDQLVTTNEYGQMIINTNSWVAMTLSTDYVKEGDDAIVLTQSFVDRMALQYPGEGIFFRFRYGGTVAAYFRLDIWKPVIAHSDLVTWSPEDNKYYKWKVVGGVPSVEPWTDQYEPITP